MSDIKSELTRRLDEAKVRYEDARREVELLAGLIDEFERLTAGDTRAFPAVPSAGLVPVRADWPLMIGQRVKVTYNDEHAHVGLLREVFPAWIEIEVGKDKFSPAVSAVTSIVAWPEQFAPPVDSHPTGAHQLPDPAVTLTDPPVTRPDCPGCDDYARSPEGCPEHGHDYAQDGADHG